VNRNAISRRRLLAVSVFGAEAMTASLISIQTGMPIFPEPVWTRAEFFVSPAVTGFSREIHLPAMPLL
jgi:hypothetical protein